MTASNMIRVIWVVFFGYWFWSARSTKKVVSSEPTWTRIAHLTAMIVSFTLVLAGEFLPDFLREPLLPPSFPWEIVGVGISSLGVSFAIWARVTLGANWSGAVTLKKGHQIIKTGPYQWVRHPIYTGIIMNILGSAIVSEEIRGLIAIVLVVVAYLVKIPKEEKLLSKHFPKDYPKYRAKTWKLVPFIF